MSSANTTSVDVTGLRARIAPAQIVQAAIGNLLRKAIEHSGRGRISVRLGRDAAVVIDDPGRGMSPEEISILYARLARGPGRDGGGIVWT